MKRPSVGLSILIIFLTASLASAGEKGPVEPHAKDRCPVCGMFPARHPDSAGQILFKDGTYAVFDGVKDMFKYYFKLKKYNLTKKLSDIDSIYVKDYFSLTFTDGYSAWYVTGSNVYGPMGRELIPFGKESEAKVFMVDHVGKSLSKFDEVTYDLVKGLE